MLVVTGGAGFLGSAVIWKLNEAGRKDILVVDALGSGEKWRNLVNRSFADFLHKDEFLRRLRQGGDPFGVTAVVHMGACSATTERDADFLHENNTRYTTELCRFCLEHGARFVTASSAATYGDGSRGFDDGPEGLDRLRPLNMYGYSKHRFDLTARDNGWLNSIASLKFFNVYGPNEYHKGDMRSVACKSFEQIRDTGGVRLFRSHRPDYADGGQLRDFVSVKDCAEVVAWLLEHPEANGVFNVGTGAARSFTDLALAVFEAMGAPPRIEYVDIPEQIRDRYQYYTQAPVDRLRAAGYRGPFASLEEGVRDYVRNHLLAEDPYL
ncbi:ADP-L-glycero-D-manno-heptose-6-epimerase [Fundidesulfovibrio magnetotacticus]|uniref:ADP-L-glycero-D-manno-heptose-6-epimerase n=1 Tax=Fundidesulfovibrio magnetotacticus TaxID=2730080 RepID=A0A6V8LTF3_9BACT|nr:ADP-glyceromanno-heptose 6-epimerase [Fundidesulfovibrio magnetotacticus]GFK93369.1 ADP-L-glycero-D-manno-heptose-6-epimerase [Fundidesulfovibrio magnetotacticus]